jgi:hypothetical protein
MKHHGFVDDPIRPVPMSQAPTVSIAPPVSVSPAPTHPVLRKPFCRACDQVHDTPAGMFSLVRYRDGMTPIRLGLFCDESCLELWLESGRFYPTEP